MQDTSPQVKDSRQELNVKDELITQSQKQTKLLESINGKLSFFVFVTVVYIIFAILGALMSF